MPVHEVARQGFGSEAEAYDRGRPEYPQEAIAWLVEQTGLGPGRVVVDVGAGTGKLTRALERSGATLIAVEPIAGMREILARRVPRARLLDAVAEALPLADASIDAVAVGQAFHWFDGPRALDEFARVLRPDGRLALASNLRDRDDPLMVALEGIMEPYRRGAPSNHAESPSAFGEEAPFEFEHSYTLPFVELRDRAELVDRIVSVSFIAALPNADKREVIDRVEALAGSATLIELNYLSEVTLYRRKAQGA